VLCILVCLVVLNSTQAPSRPSKHPARGRGVTLPDTHPPSPTALHMPTSTSSGSLGIPTSISASSSGSSQQTLLAPPGMRLGLPAAATNGGMLSVPGGAPVLVGKIQQPVRLALPEEQTDNWDDDFEEGISLSKIQGLF
jgi:hypothetical protein